MGIGLTEHDVVLMRARAAVGYIEQQIELAQATASCHGSMRPIARGGWRPSNSGAGCPMPRPEPACVKIIFVKFSPTIARTNQAAVPAAAGN